MIKNTMFKPVLINLRSLLCHSNAVLVFPWAIRTLHVCGNFSVTNISLQRLMAFAKANLEKGRCKFNFDLKANLGKGKTQRNRNF